MFSPLALASLASLTIAGCSSTTSTTPTTGIPSGVMANSRDAATISVQWTRTSDDVTADTVVVMASGAVVNSVPAASPSNTATVSGLTEGTLYTISVHSAGGASSSINWMTARRSTLLTIYETADNNPGEYSGLQLNGPSGTARVISTNPAVEPNAASEADFVLGSYTPADDPTDTSGISLVAGNVSGSGFSNGLATLIAGPSVLWKNGGMDSLYMASEFSGSGITYNSYNIQNASVGNTSAILLVKTADGHHYAKVEIVPQSDGHLFGGTAGRNFIQVRVSYQNAADEAYASRGRPVLSPMVSKHSIPGN